MTRDHASADQSGYVPSADRGSVDDYGDYVYTDNDFEVAACISDFNQDSADMDSEPEMSSRAMSPTMLFGYSDELYDEDEFEVAIRISKASSDTTVSNIETHTVADKHYNA